MNNGDWVEVTVERHQHSTVVTVNDRKEELQVPVSLLSDVYAEPFLHPQGKTLSRFTDNVFILFINFLVYVSVVNPKVNLGRGCL